MKSAAVGFRAHSGWAVLVAVYLEKGEPVVLSRQRVHLVKTFNYSFRQPYHTAEKMPLPDGRKFISQVRAEAARLASSAVEAVQSKLGETEYRLSRFALLVASGRALPDLSKILTAHTLIHTADGELFREALSVAGRRYGLSEFRARERGLLGCGAEALRLSEGTLLKRLTELGRGLGPPWSQDEKYAALAAWLALRERGAHGSRRRIA
jgi:hypothetical protein